mgnify:CR=1 FL=1
MGTTYSPPPNQLSIGPASHHDGARIKALTIIFLLLFKLLMDIIGRGAFGVVFRAVHRHRGNWVAIKNVRLNKKKKSQLNSLMVSEFSQGCRFLSRSF